MWDLEDAVFSAANYLGKSDAIIVPQPGKAGFSRPVNGQVISGFGPRTHPVTGEVGKPHEGVDFACSYGQPIPASKSGKVIMAGWQNASNPSEGYGQYVRVDHRGGMLISMRICLPLKPVLVI